MMKNLSYRIIGLLMLTSAGVMAQSDGPLTLSSAGTTGAYTSNASITLAPGFSTTGTFSATIQAQTCATLLNNFTLSQNFVLTNIPRIAGFTNIAQLTGVSSCSLQQAVQYVDGLGRPIQTIQVQASPLGLDMVAPQAYDSYGREVYKYLPYTLFRRENVGQRPKALASRAGD